MVAYSAPTALLNSEDYNELTDAVSLFPRSLAGLSNVAGLANQVLNLAFFTPIRPITTTQLYLVGGTAAGATPSLVRAGLWIINSANTDANIVADIPNDPAIFASANTAWLRSWTTPYRFIPGQRYACGLLCVTDFTAPTVGGQLFLSGLGVFANRIGNGPGPRLSGLLPAQTDLPASFSLSSLQNVGSRFWAECI